MVLSVAVAFGIMAAIWALWFAVGAILLLSAGAEAVTGQPWYEIAVSLVALGLLCWPSSWAYINSREDVEESPTAEE